MQCLSTADVSGTVVLVFAVDLSPVDMYCRYLTLDVDIKYKLLKNIGWCSELLAGLPPEMRGFLFINI